MASTPTKLRLPFMAENGKFRGAEDLAHSLAFTLDKVIFFERADNNSEVERVLRQEIATVKNPTEQNLYSSELDRLLRELQS